MTEVLHLILTDNRVIPDQDFRNEYGIFIANSFIVSFIKQ